jgi:hypothetical protein
MTHLDFVEAAIRIAAWAAVACGVVIIIAIVMARWPRFLSRQVSPEERAEQIEVHPMLREIADENAFQAYLARIRRGPSAISIIGGIFYNWLAICILIAATFVVVRWMGSHDLSPLEDADKFDLQ